MDGARQKILQDDERQFQAKMKKLEDQKKHFKALITKYDGQIEKLSKNSRKLDGKTIHLAAWQTVIAMKPNEVKSVLVSTIYPF